MKDEGLVRQLFISLCQASIDKDIDLINSILAEDYILVHMTGMKQSKSDYIKSVLTGELKYYEVVYEDIDVKVNGNSANVIGKTKILASPFGVSKSWWKLRQDMELEKINGKWIIKKSVASMY